MSELEQISNKIELACNEIEKRRNGRINPNEDEIIAEECIIHNVSESHIRLLLNIDVGRRSSRYFKEVK